MKIAFFSDNYMPTGEILDPFRALLFKAVARLGGDVLYVQANDYQSPAGAFLSSKARDKVLGALRRFQPDVILSLNRAGLNQTVLGETQARVLSWYIDNPNRFPPALRKFTPQETVYCATRYMMDWLKRESPTASTEYFPFCTDEDLFSPEPAVSDDKKCDVSFVGTLWEPAPFLKMVQQMATSSDGHEMIRRGLAEYVSNYDSSFPQEIQKIFPEKSVTQIKNILDDFLSSRRRLEYLSELSDLDLKIYGTTSWLGQTLLRSDRFFGRFTPVLLETPEALASLYRESRVAISIAHQQAQSGFPIRIFDILATGTPLVTDTHAEMNELFEVGKCFLPANTAGEASEAVRRLLKDKDLVRRMSGAAVEAVRSQHTFRHRLKAMTGESMQSEGAKRVELLSERLSPAFLKNDPRFARTQVSASVTSRQLTVAQEEKLGTVEIIKRLLKVGLLSLYVPYLLARFALSSARRGKEGRGKAKPVGGLCEAMIRDYKEMLLTHSRTLLIQISLLKEKN